ncbi:MAG: arsenate reductase ArsC [Flavobacteriales bacterium]
MKKLLFVCIENSNRSQMAEAFARIYGAELVEPYSAGSSPSGEVNSKAIAAMREIGYELSTHRSKSLDDVPRVLFDYLVTMGCGEQCPHVQAKNRLDWDIPDPKNMNMAGLREVRKLIERHVKDLLKNMDNSRTE